MMDKSLIYAYADGGQVISATPPPRAEPTYTPEQLAQMEENRRIREAAEASIAASRAEQARIHAENPDVDFSDAGHERAVQEAMAALAAGQGAAPQMPSGGVPTADPFNAAPMPDLNLAMGNVAGAFSEPVQYGSNPVLASDDLTVQAPAQTYVPPEYAVVQPQPIPDDSPYLMYSNPINSVFIRNGG